MREKEEVKEKVTNGDSSSRFTGIAAVSAAGGSAAIGSAVYGVSKLVKGNNNLVNNKVKVSKTIDTDEITNNEGTTEKLKKINQTGQKTIYVDVK